MRQISEFSRPLVKSVYHGSQNVPFLGPKIWEVLLDDCKNIDNLNAFKNKVKKLKPEKCPCRHCKINSIGFIFGFILFGFILFLKVVFLELWLLLSSIVLQPIITFFSV